jgi:hypothetical protein
MALAAGAVYFFDPVSGRRRRVLLGDQCTRAARRVNRETRDVREGLSDRMHDFAEGARARFASPTSDKAIGKHLRNAMKRAVSHPEAIGVKIRDGIIFLRGDIYSHEHQRLLDEIRSIPGLHVVTDHLVLREAAEGLRRLPNAAGKVGDGWSVAGRLAAGATGCALLFWGVRERKALGEFGTSVGQAFRRASKMDLDDVRDAVHRGIDAVEERVHGAGVEGDIHAHKSWHGGESSSPDSRVAV